MNKINFFDSSIWDSIQNNLEGHFVPASAKNSIQHKMKYRKKPIIINAVQYTNPQSVLKMFEIFGSSKGINNSDDGLFISTKKGTMIAKKGDYVIQGIKGEIYPCDKEIFEESYEIVE